MWVRVHNPRNNRTVRALVLDVGPWWETDHAYVFQFATDPDSGLTVPAETVRPRAESGPDPLGRVTNGAGIDLSEWCWVRLGMTDNTEVGWRFD